jgi:hypothetical protein
MREKMEHPIQDACFATDNATTLFQVSHHQTIYISGGKKNKLNKIDIVISFSKGKLEKGDLD